MSINNDVLTWNELIPFLSGVYLTNYEKMSLEIILKLSKECSLFNWITLSDKVISDKVINSPELFNKIQWDKVIRRIKLGQDLINKIIKSKNVKFGLIVDRIKIEREVYYRYIPSLKPQDHWLYFKNQDFDMDDFKKFLYEQIRISNSNDMDFMIKSLSKSPFLILNIMDDTHLSHRLDWSQHLVTHQYQSQIIINKIILIVQNQDKQSKGEKKDIHNLITSKAWMYQKDITYDLIKNLLKLCKTNSEKNILWNYVSKNPHLDAHILEKELKKGNSYINLDTIQSYRNLPIWFLNKNTFYISSFQYFIRNNFTQHFLARQILKYFGLDPLLQQEKKDFLPCLVRFCNLHKTFLRGLSELVINSDLHIDISNKYWKNVAIFQELDLKFITNYTNYLDASLVQSHQKINSEVIEWFKKIGKIDWNFIQQNDYFYAMDPKDHEFYSIEYSKIIKDPYWLQGLNSSTDWIELNINANYFMEHTNFYPRVIFAYDLLHFYVKPKDKINFSNLKKGDKFETNLRCDPGKKECVGYTFIQYYNTCQNIDTIPICDINLYKEFYRENPRLMQYPCYIKVRFRPSDYFWSNEFTSKDIGDIYYQKQAQRIQNVYFVRSFEIVDVIYFNDL